jgi:hypothetical protein
MEPEQQQELFDDKYAHKLEMSYSEWIETAPNTEDEAYAACQAIDDELKNTYEQWFNATGDEREELDDYRDKLKLEYDLIEELFGLELKDR